MAARCLVAGLRPPAAADAIPFPTFGGRL